jgi:hypothetical protein
VSEFIRVVLGAAGAVLVGGVFSPTCCCAPYAVIASTTATCLLTSIWPPRNGVAAWNAANGATSTNSC